VIVKRLQTADTTFALALIALGVVLALFDVSAAGSTVALYNLRIDADTYLPLAGAVAERGLSAIPTTQPPGFITYLATLKYLGFDPARATKFLNPIWLALIAWLAFLLASRCLNRLTALVACGMVALSPLLRAYSATAQYEVLSALLILASVSSVLKARDTTSLKWGVGAGAIAALSALTRETALLFLPFFALALRGNRRLLVVYLSLALIPVALWIFYQHQRYGVWVPISSKGAVNLAIGFNPNANGTYHGTMKPPIEPMGLEFIKRFPLDALSLALRKLGILWGFIYDGWNVPRAASLWLNRITWGVFDYATILLVTRSFVSLLALVGLLMVVFDRALRKRPELIFAGYALVLVSLIHTALISSARFIVPVMPFVCIFAALPLARALVYAGQKRVFIALLLGASLCLYHWSPNRLRYSVELEETDGFEVTNASCLECSAGAARIVSKGSERRIVSLWGDAFLPAGQCRLELISKVSSAADNQPAKPITVIGYGARREVVFKGEAKPLEGIAHKLEYEANIPTNSSIAVALRSDPGLDYLLDRGELECFSDRS
jgi:hypothetical protein